MDTPQGSVWQQVRLWGGALLGVALMAWFLWSLQWGSLVAVMAEAHWSWVALAATAMLGSYAVHAWRWRILLHDIDPDVDWSTLWSATTVLWGFNTVLPLRAGNFLRPAVVAMRRQASYTAVLFTTVGEYLCDAIGIVILLLVMIWVLPAEYVESGPLEDVQWWGTAAAVVALISLAVVVLLSTRQARTLVERLLSPLPSSSLRESLLTGFDHLVAGMATVGHPARLGGALVLTLAVWGAWLLAILATFRAFDLHLPLAAALFWESSLTLSMMVPQAPGYLGVFQVVTEESLALFRAPTEKAEAIALVFWTVCFVPITILGVYNGSKLGFSVSSGVAGALDELAEVTSDG
ncbi:MAG: flippase-like domain-containing protein [Myxococcales bacterium]|nr:flippase-like domain-containing protein [Myxococcales bacterium]